MIRFVVTGGIAAGKSNLIALFSELGIPTLSADAVGHKIANTPLARRQITEAFGEDCYVDGELDRRKLGKLVFADKQKRDRLNDILHTLIYEEILQWMDAQQGQALAVEIPLLFESDMAHIADVILHCYVPKDEQLRRIMQRNGLTEEEALQRIHAQMSTEEKMARAHHNIDTSGSYEDTRRTLYQILKQYEVKHAT